MSTKTRQKKLGEVRIQVPYYRIRVWKDYPLSQEDALAKLCEIRDELTEALEKVEKQIKDLVGAV